LVTILTLGTILQKPSLDTFSWSIQCGILEKPTDQNCVDALKGKFRDNFAPDDATQTGSITTPTPTFQN